MKKVLWFCIALLASAAVAMTLPSLPAPPPRQTGFHPGAYPTPAHVELGIRPQPAVVSEPPPPGPKADAAVAATVLIQVHPSKISRKQCGGFVVDRTEGLIVTSYHPFQKSGEIYLSLPLIEKGFAVSNPTRYGPQTKSYVGRVVTSDPRRDLALLRVESLPAAVPELALASGRLALGDPLRLVAHPGPKNLVWDETRGKAGKSEPMHWTTADGQHIRGLFLSFDAAEAGQLGCSGSPVVDRNLGVVGVAAAGSPDADSKIIYCVDASEVRPFLSAAYLQLGWDAYRRGEYGRSSANFEKSRRFADRPALALLGSGFAHWRQGKWEPAARAFAWALQLGWVDGPSAVGRSLALLWDAPNPQAWIHDMGGFFGLANFGDDLLLRRTERAARNPTEDDTVTLTFRSTAAAALMGLLVLGWSSRADEPSFQGKTVEEWTTQLKDKYWPYRETAAKALRKFGPDAEPSLPALGETVTDDKDWPVRVAAATTLGVLNLKPGDSAPFLAKALKDKEWPVRAAAAEALGTLGGGAESAAKALGAAASDPDTHVRDAALKALALFGPAGGEAAPALGALLKDPDGDRRKTLLGVIRKIGPKAGGATPGLIGLLRDQDHQVRQAAAETIAEIGPGAKEATPILTACLRASEWNVRVAAAQALGKIGPGAREANAALNNCLRDGEWPVRVAAAGALGELAPTAKNAEALSALLRDDDWAVRNAAVQSLGKMGATAKEAVPALLTALKDSDVTVAQGAALALKQIDPKAAKAAGIR